MADDVTLPGTGDVVAADDVSGVKYQRVKLDIGGDGVSSPVVSGNPLPVSGTVTANAGTNLNTSALALESGGNLAAIATDAAAIEALLTTIDADTSRIPALGQATMAASAPVVIASDQAAIPTTPAGGVAHDGVDSGNPLKIGLRATNTEIAAVANNDRTDAVATLTGKPIVQPYSVPENFVSGAITTAMTGTTSTSLVATPGSNLRNYITTIIVSNAHATVGTDVVIQDGSGGTVLATIPAAPGYGGAVVTFPMPLRQPTANTALYCANVTTGASTKVSAFGYKGA